MKNVLCLAVLCLFMFLSPIGSFLYSYPFRKPDFKTAFQTARERPSDPYWLSALALHYTERGDFTNAVLLYKKCLKLEPDNPECYLRLTSVYLKMGRPDFADPVIAPAARDFPMNGKIQSAMADVRYKMGDFSNAVRYFEISLRLPGTSNSSFVYCGLAKSCREMKRHDLSEHYFRLALSVKKDLWTFYEYGKLLQLRKNSEHAAWAFAKARSLSFRQNRDVVKLLEEKLAGAYYDCAIKMKEQGKKKEALKYFDRILNDRGLKNTAFAERASFWKRRM